MFVCLFAHSAQPAAQSVLPSSIGAVLSVVSLTPADRANAFMDGVPTEDSEQGWNGTLGYSGYSGYSRYSTGFGTVGQ